MTTAPIHLPIYSAPDREKLVVWRKEVIAARQNWQAAIQIIRKTDFIWLRRRRQIAVCKAEAADCLKHERACTQIIEHIDGKRAFLGEMTGDRTGHLLPRVPPELVSAFRYCLAIST